MGKVPICPSNFSRHGQSESSRAQPPPLPECFARENRVKYETSQADLVNVVRGTYVERRRPRLRRWGGITGVRGCVEF